MPLISDHTGNMLVYNSAPGTLNLGVSSTPSYVKYANSFQFRAGGRISPTVTTANAPSLALATYQKPYPDGTAAVVGALSGDAGTTDTGIKSCQFYTLVATLPTDSGRSATTYAALTPTFSWLAGPAFSKYRQPTSGDIAMPDKYNQCAIGWVLVVNGNSTDFTPGTTSLATPTTTYYDNWGVAGS